MNLEDIFTPYFQGAQHYVGVITPYALHLLYLMFLVEVITIAITYMMGSDDPPELLWRIIRLIFTGGFGYYWIVNAWALGLTVLGSFDQLGVILTGQPNLTPMAFIKTALRLSELIFSAPSTNRLLPDFALRIEEFLLANTIFLIFLVVAALALFTLTAAYIILAGGVILVPLLTSRFTSPMAEGYFTWLVKTGVVIFFFYLVLGIAEVFVANWGTKVAGLCGAGAFTLPSPVLGTAPLPAYVLTCTTPIFVPDLLRLLADTVILAFIAIGIPFTAGAIVSHGINASLEHFAAAKYLAGGAGRSIAAAAWRGAASAATHVYQRMQQQSTLNQRMEAGAAAAARTSSSTPTTPLGPPLSPPPSSGGGWNGRPSGPPIAPPPSGPHNSGPGGSPAGLTYYPGRPGAQTKAEAIDITKLQTK
jgi:type IV secretion system protein VirB6/type IV secretion system protein TrbL